MSIFNACRLIEGWDTLDVYRLREMLLQAVVAADRDGCRMDEMLDITDLPTAHAKDLYKVKGRVVWACDVNRNCLVGPEFDVESLDDLLAM